MKSLYGITRMQYNSIISAIPQEWKIFFQENPTISYTPLPPHTIDQYLGTNSRQITRDVYKFNADDAMIIHNKFIKWRHELGEEYDQTLTEFAKAHEDIYKIANVPKYRSFQYRLIQRGLVTNVQLYQWDIVSTPLCSFCQTHQETPKHLMFECEKVRQLWERVFDYIDQTYGQQEWNINTVTIIFNRVVERKNHIANFICLFTKQFIYRQRCLGEHIHFPIWKAQVKKVENVEKYIAVKNNRTQIHNRKWYPPPK